MIGVMRGVPSIVQPVSIHQVLAPTLGTIAPCSVGAGKGQAHEPDGEEKECCCHCHYFNCSVDFANRVTATFLPNVQLC